MTTPRHFFNDDERRAAYDASQRGGFLRVDTVETDNVNGTVAVAAAYSVVSDRDRATVLAGPSASLATIKTYCGVVDSQFA